MFTGIIEEIGYVVSKKELDDGLELEVNAQQISKHVSVGSSVSINGICSTVVVINENKLTFQYSRQTLDITTVNDLDIDTIVNLESALTPSKELGGHYVTGHVDELAELVEVEKSGINHIITFRFNKENSAYLIPKGSICIDGISLTIAKLTDDMFSCAIIPHTWENTNLKKLIIGNFVNIEYDMIGKYVVRTQSLK